MKSSVAWPVRLQRPGAETPARCILCMIPMRSGSRAPRSVPFAGGAADTVSATWSRIAAGPVCPRRGGRGRLEPSSSSAVSGVQRPYQRLRWRFRPAWWVVPSVLACRPEHGRRRAWEFGGPAVPFAPPYLNRTPRTYADFRPPSASPRSLLFLLTPCQSPDTGVPLTKRLGTPPAPGEASGPLSRPARLRDCGTCRIEGSADGLRPGAGIVGWTVACASAFFTRPWAGGAAPPRAETPRLQPYEPR
jgi:hypothetical protein